MDHLVVTLIFVLLPGIVSAVVVDKLIYHSRWTSFRFTLYALLLGILSYMALQLGYWVRDWFATCKGQEVVWSSLDFWDAVVSEKPSINKMEVFLTTILAIPLAFIVSFVVNRKLINRAAQRLRVSTKYGDQNLYSTFLNEESVNWVYVRDIEHNLTYFGAVHSFSENEHCQELALRDVIVYRYSDSKELYHVPTLYLSRDIGKLIIETPTPPQPGESHG